MSEKNSNFGPDDTTPEIMDRLISRLGKAGWLNGLQAVDPKGVSLQYSAKGSKHMATLGKICEAHSPGCLNPETPIHADLALAIKLGTAVPELVSLVREGPKEESAALFRLIACYHREHGDEPPPLTPRF